MARYNVVKDYDWTSIPRGSDLRNKAPRAWVKSYKLNSNGILKRFRNYYEVLKIEDADDFYQRLYGTVTTPEDDFNFPFFGDSVRSFSNTFGDTFQNGFGDGGGIGTALDSTAQALLGTVAQVGGLVGTSAINEAIMLAGKGEIKGALKALGGGIASGGNPGSYIETPKFYQYENNDAPLDVSFVLSNTINDDYDKNHKLIQRLTYINRPFRKNSIAMDPPRIFRVGVPGHRYIKWAYCSSFGVNLMGTKREIGGVIVPEAYQISMSFTSLTVEVSNFQEKA
jgi:hypothetical protein